MASPPDPDARRVLRRALDLQLAERRGGPTDLSEHELAEVAEELDIAPEHLRRALAEERLAGAPLPERRAAQRLAGPARAWATRELPGSPAEVLERLDRHLQRREAMRVGRRTGDGLTWEKRPGAAGRVRRTYGKLIGSARLRGVSRVSGSAAPIDGTTSLIRVEVDLSSSRAAALLGGGAVAGGGSAASLTWAATSGWEPLAAISLVALGAGSVVVGRQARRATRIEGALDAVLDAVEHGEPSEPDGSVLKRLPEVGRWLPRPPRPPR